MKLAVPTFILSCSIVLAIGGCTSESEQASNTQPPSNSNNDTADNSTPAPAVTPVSWIISEEPLEIMDVAAAKKTVMEGDSVALRGRIGGQKEAMTPTVGLFLIVDSAIPHCDDLHPGACAAPWDYCCEAPETLSASNATVLFVDESGAPLTMDFAAGGLEPMMEVVVVGTVAARPNEGVLTIMASGVHVVEK